MNSSSDAVQTSDVAAAADALPAPEPDRFCFETADFVSVSAEEADDEPLSALIITVSHGGKQVIPGAPKRTTGVIDGDQFTRELAVALRDEMARLEVALPHLVINEASRLYVDTNRGQLSEATLNSAVAPPPAYMSNTDPFEPVEGNPAERTYRRFHERVHARIEKLRSRGQRAFLLDLHGNSMKRLEGRVYVTGSAMTCTGGKPLRAQLCLLLNEEGIATNAREVFTGDGVFTGGFTSHHYGREVEGCDAVQAEVHVDFRKTAADAVDCGARMARALARFMATRP